MTKKFPKKTFKLSIVVTLATVAAAADAASEENLARYQCKPVQGSITRSSICIDRGTSAESKQTSKPKEEQ